MKRNFTWYVLKIVLVLAVLFWVTSVDAQNRVDRTETSTGKIEFSNSSSMDIYTMQAVNTVFDEHILGGTLAENRDFSRLEDAGVSQNMDADDYIVYPNPFNDVIYIGNYEKISRLFITNVVGHRVKEITKPTNMIPTSDLRNGIYFITLMLDGDVIVSTQRLVKR